MRLTTSQKEVVLGCYPSASLVRFGDVWGVVWQDADASPRARWHGQLVKEVRAPSKAEIVRFIAAGVSLDDLDHIVVWAGTEIIGRMRRVVVAALSTEAL